MYAGKNVFYLPGATSDCDFLYTAVMAVERDGRLKAGPHTLPCMYVCMYVCGNIYALFFVCLCVFFVDYKASINNAHIYIHTYIHIYIHTYIHIYIHTYIHTCFPTDKAEKIYKEKIRTNEQLILECVGKANK